MIVKLQLPLGWCPHVQVNCFSYGNDISGGIFDGISDDISVACVSDGLHW